jgi:hypothetical protein
MGGKQPDIKNQFEGIGSFSVGNALSLGLAYAGPNRGLFKSKGGMTFPVISISEHL